MPARWFLALVAAAGIAAAVAVGSVGDAFADTGKTLFEQRCAGCHTIGGGSLVGPDLAGVTKRRTRDWIVRFILAPGSVIASGDPVAKQLRAQYGITMPDLGLSKDQVDLLIAYLQATGGAGSAESAPPAQATPTTTQTAAAGNVAAGKNLFTGSDRFANGGPPCMSCHTVAGIGSLGGGAIGPDLTQAYAKYGRGLGAVLSTVAFPTMQPVFAGKPLTEPEVASLVAFLAQAPQGKRTSAAVGKLLGLGLGGAAGFVLIALGVWRGRLIAVRRPLIVRSTNRRR